jgi:hypothetical protein
VELLESALKKKSSKRSRRRCTRSPKFSKSRTTHNWKVRLSNTSGVAIEEKSSFNDSTDDAALAEEVADHITRRASGRSDLEAAITVSDGE